MNKEKLFKLFMAILIVIFTVAFMKVSIYIQENGESECKIVECYDERYNEINGLTCEDCNLKMIYSVLFILFATLSIVFAGGFLLYCIYLVFEDLGRSL